MSKRNQSPRMADVAKAAGVSTMTVSRAFRHDGSISDKRRNEILKLAEEMGYVFDMSASELRSKKSGFVTFTVPSLNNPNFADTVLGMTDMLAEHDLEVLLGYTDYQIDKEERMIRQLLRRNPEALVVTGSTHTAEARRIMEQAAIPVVECWDAPKSPIGHSVGFSNDDAGALMAQHLIEQGYRKIAFIGGETDTDTRGQARRRGFAGHLAEAGLEATRIVTAGKPPVDARRGARGAKLVREMYPDTEAVMCVSDSAAFGAMTEFQRLGLSVPEDMAVAGFGAFDVSQFAIPPITTVDPNARAIGARVADLLVTILRGEPDGDGLRHVAVKPTAVPRASTNVSK